MQLRNNYDKGVFNGDLGRIASIDREESSIKVDFYDKLVEYESDELDEINLAYATSVSQKPGKRVPGCGYSTPPLTICCFTAAFSTRR